MKNKTNKIPMFIMTILLLTIVSGNLFSQHRDLDVMPRHIHFENQFMRIRKVVVKNMEMKDIRVDSITFDKSVLSIRLNDVNPFPITLQQNESFSFDVILFNYFNLNNNDSLKSIKIYNNGNLSIVELEVGINSMMQNMMHGIIKGTVKDSTNILPDARVYFFYNATLLLDSTITNSQGNYEKELPVGNYFVSAIKSNYYMQYASGKSSPLEADFINVKKDSVRNLDFILEKEIESGISVSGTLIDIISAKPLRNKIVVVRRGKHNPTKVSGKYVDQIDRSYTVITDTAGNYTIPNIIVPGNYYIQAFSELYIPGYYSENNQPAVLWQDADSVMIDGTVSSKDIYMERDSSFGGGLANGQILYDNLPNDPVKDAILYAVSNDNNRIYSYNYAGANGSFNIHELPYGSYRLLSQKIGIDDAVSTNFEISTSQDSVFDIIMTMIPTSVDNFTVRPEDFILYQNYPNPFNPSTVVEYSLPKASYVHLGIYDATGKKVSTLVNKLQSAGKYQIVFNASSKAGGLSSGVYFYRLSAGNISITRKMLLLR